MSLEDNEKDSRVVWEERILNTLRMGGPMDRPGLIDALKKQGLLNLVEKDYVWRLIDQGRINVNHEGKLEAAKELPHLLDREIQKIKSPTIRKFVEQALLEADPMFWKVPCSSSGKYHPPEDQIEGGLIVHIQKGVAVIEQFARRALFSEIELDAAIAAYLIHDICKDGVPPWGKHTDYTHGLLASKWLEQFSLHDRVVKTMILDAVRYHMAPWCYAVDPFKDRQYTKEEMMANINELQRALTNPSRVELAVREADYWSSRETMSFMPGKSIVFDPRVHDTPEEWLDILAKDYGLKVVR